MKNIYIVGAGGFGRELHGWLHSPGGLPSGWSIAGFLDDVVPGPIAGLPVHATASFKPGAADGLLLAIGKPSVKKTIFNNLKARGALFVTYVHPSAMVAASARLGEGCVLCPGALVSNAAVLEDAVSLNAYGTVGHDVRIGAFSTLSSHVDITGGAILGEGVFLGSHACIVPKVLVGNYATVGAGSVAVRKVADGTTVFGVPAKKIS